MTGRRRRNPVVLCVDVGNTLLKLDLVKGGRVRRLVSLPTRGCDRGPAGRRWARAVEAVGGADGLAVSSVVPDLTRRLSRSLLSVTGCDPLIVDHRAPLPFTVAVHRPARVGPDRLCAAAGALTGRAHSVIAIDVGSAITVDVVHQRRFLGGLILAGPSLSLRALGRYARRLPDIDWFAQDAFPSDFGTTRRSMTLGTSVGAVGGIREAVRLLERRVGRRPRTVITGGAAMPLRRALPATWLFEARLVSLGLYRIWCEAER